MLYVNISNTLSTTISSLQGKCRISEQWVWEDCNSNQNIRINRIECLDPSRLGINAITKYIYAAKIEELSKVRANSFYAKQPKLLQIWIHWNHLCFERCGFAPPSHGDSNKRAGGVSSRHAPAGTALSAIAATVPCLASRLRVPFAMGCRLPACFVALLVRGHLQVHRNSGYLEKF